MMVEFKVGNARFKLKEMTEEYLNNLIEDPMMSLFMPGNSKSVIKKAFNEALKTGNWIELEDEVI